MKPPPQVDMDKVLAAIAKKTNALAAGESPVKPDINKVKEMARLYGQGIYAPRRNNAPIVNHKQTTKVRKGCSGFNHPNLHP